MGNTTNANWDESSPALTDPRRDGAQEIRVLRGGVRTRLLKEHTAPAALGVGGEHLAGSARSYYQAGAPTTKPDTVTPLDGTDAGRIWVDSDDNSYHVWTGSAWAVFGLDSFTKNDDGSSANTTFPFTQGTLSAGTWMVFVYGTLEAAPGLDIYTCSLTVNTIQRKLFIGNHPDGCAPFFIPLQVTVTGAGTISITAAEYINRIQGMVGWRIA